MLSVCEMTGHSITAETFRNMEDMSFFTHARIFDDLLIIAQKETNCFVLRSSEGLIVLDAIWPCSRRLMRSFLRFGRPDGTPARSENWC